MTEDELEEIEDRWNRASKGRWMWEINPKYHNIDLRTSCGMIVMDFVRWGMGGAAPRFRDEKDILHRVDTMMEPIPGREHHAHWAQRINHPDAVVIAAAPEDIRSLIAEVRRLRAENERLEREFATYAEIKTDRNEPGEVEGRMEDGLTTLPENGDNSTRDDCQ